MEFIADLKKDSWRMLMMGQTRSGKTQLLTKKILPAISSTFDYIFILTREFNESFYKKQMENMGRKETKKYEDDKLFKIITFDNPETKKTDILTVITNIKNTQSENILETDEEGNRTYNDRILMIFDDILDENLMKNEVFMELFYNFRHLDISVVLLSQITNKDISTQMKSNTEHNIFFKLSDYYQQRYPIDVITNALTSKERTFEKAKPIAEELYRVKCLEKEFGYIITSKGKLY